MGRNMVSAIQPLTLSQSALSQSSSVAPATPKPTGPAQGFKELFDKLASGPNSKDVFSNALHKELGAIQQKAIGGGALEARELLLYQIKSSNFNLRVELVSKLSESLLGTLRKLQSQP
jgi:hypothetical protein